MNSSVLKTVYVSSCRMKYSAKQKVFLYDIFIKYLSWRRCCNFWWKYPGHSLLGCDSMLWCGRIPTFQRTMLLLSSGVLQNVGILPHHYIKCHNPEDHDLNLYHYDNLSACKNILVLQGHIYIYIYIYINIQNNVKVLVLKERRKDITKTVYFDKKYWTVLVLD
jgi:hypothetical protein